MRVPNIINENTFKTYQLKQDPVTARRKLKSDHFSWDEKFVKTLKFLCLESIKNNWKDYPLYHELKYVIDRQILSEILSCELPLSLTVPIIDDDFYWKRRYEYFWPTAPKPLMYIKDIEQFYHPTLPPVDKDGIKDKIEDENTLEQDEKIDIKENEVEDKAKLWEEFIQKDPIKKTPIKKGNKFFKRVNNLIRTVNNLSSLSSREENDMNNNNGSISNNNGNNSIKSQKSPKASPKISSTPSKSSKPSNSPKPSPKLSLKSSNKSDPSVSSKQDSVKLESSRKSSEGSRKLSLPSRKASVVEIDEEVKVDIQEDEIEGHFMEVPLVKSWKICYLEKYFQEILQDLEPTEFNQENIREIIDLIGDYIYSLKLKTLKAAAPSDELPLQSNDHIPLDMIIGSLPNLFEINICFTELGLGDNFLWDKTSVSERDCKLLGQGFEKSDLKICRVIKSNINGVKLELFLRPLLKNMNLKILDLSHCIIGDDGVESLVAGLRQYPGIESLVLVNNKIGVEGAEYLAGYLKELKSKPGLVNLNMKLNEIKDEGCDYLGDALINGGCTLKSICLAGCRLEGKADRFITMLKNTNNLEKIDLSNNTLGTEFGEKLLDVVVENKSIFHLDLRMCNIGTELRAKIDSVLYGNWAKRRGQISRPVVIFEMPYSML